MPKQLPNHANKLNDASGGAMVIGQTGQGLEVRGTLLNFTRFSVAFELYNPSVVLRTSEVLRPFHLLLGERTLYSGTAVVCNVIATGPAVVTCEAKLEEKSWGALDLSVLNGHLTGLRDEYHHFLDDWQKFYLIRPEYKVVLADMHTFFADFRFWVDQVELGVRAMPSGDRLDLEQKIAAELVSQARPMLQLLFDRFETAAGAVDRALVPAHQILARRQLHPLLLCAPFFYRCFTKPLGYAGDYEMVNMMFRNPAEGASLFAKVMNIWFLEQPPVVAHRNRIDYLYNQLVRFAAQQVAHGRPARILSVGCGPAQEVQRFMAAQEISSLAEFTLLDFNEETLQFASATLGKLRNSHHRQTRLHFVQKSVHRIIKESGKTVDSPPEKRFDLIYCAGLFDYLSDEVCRRLLDIMYNWLSPGGLLLATNVHTCNPSVGWMEHLVDWHLIYRDAPKMAALVPEQCPPDCVHIVAEPRGVNVFLEISKPPHG